MPAGSSSSALRTPYISDRRTSSWPSSLAARGGARLRCVERRRVELTDADLGRPSVVLTGRFEKDHERRYAHVPFEVPSRLRQLHLRYSYSDQIDSDPTITGGNTLDIGLF